MKIRLGEKVQIYLKGEIIASFELSEEHLRCLYGYNEEVDIEDYDIVEINNKNDVFSEKYIVYEAFKKEDCYEIYVDSCNSTLSLSIEEISEEFKKVNKLAWKVLNETIKFGEGIL